MMYRHRHREIVLWTLILLTVSGCGYLLPRQIAQGPTLADGEVLFRYYAPNARRVQLAGDWPENNWARGDGSVGEAKIGLMEADNNDGVWEIRVAPHDPPRANDGLEDRLRGASPPQE